MKNFKGQVGGEVVEVEVRGIIARGEGCCVISGHIFLDKSKGDESLDDFVDRKVRQTWCLEEEFYVLEK
jgi:hypothetical protein